MTTKVAVVRPAEVNWSFLARLYLSATMVLEPTTSPSTGTSDDAPPIRSSAITDQVVQRFPAFHYRIPNHIYADLGGSDVRRLYPELGK